MLHNPELLRFWVWCLMKATHKPCKAVVGYQEVNLEPGQFIFGRKKAAQELRSTEKKIRTCVQSLSNSKNLAIKSASKFSIISIINWETYQCDESDLGHQIGQERASKGPAKGHIQECKEHKNKKNKILSASEDAACIQAVYLTKRKRKLTGQSLEDFNRFWKAFGYPRGKAEAADAWLDIRDATNGTVEAIIEAAAREAERRHNIIAQGRTPKMAQGWLSGRRWEDEEKTDSDLQWDALMEVN